jgi:hypothetical protein
MTALNLQRRGPQKVRAYGPSASFTVPLAEGAELAELQRGRPIAAKRVAQL